jgi:hypothetical protein
MYLWMDTSDIRQTCEISRTSMARSQSISAYVGSLTTKGRRSNQFDDLDDFIVKQYSARAASRKQKGKTFSLHHIACQNLQNT